MRRLRKVLAAFLGTGIGVLSFPSSAQLSAAPVTSTWGSSNMGRLETPVGRGYSLQRCLDLATQNYPSVAEARARLEQANAQLSEARTAPYSAFSASAGAALAPTVRGTNIFSPDTDVALSESMALAWQIDVSGTIPLWTFGKIASLVDAATAQTHVKKYDIAKVKSQVKLSVRRAYFGVVFAQDALGLLQEAMRQIDKHLTALERAVATEDADEVDLYKMQMYRAELDARESEARRQLGIALAGLKILIGATEPIAVSATHLPPPKHRLAPLSYYLSAARIYRPEVNMARAGLVAREAQLRLERAKYYPDLGLTLAAGWGQAPEVTDQVNPFVRDPGNYLRYGFAIGLKWKLDFLPQTARVAYAEAQLEELRATEQFALGGVGVEVEKAFLEAQDAETRLAAYSRAVGFARRWLITVQQGIDVGIYADEDMVQPAKEYATKRFSEMSATYDYHIALGQLAVATGFDAVASAEAN